jgi:uracil-DNA glycosylase family 4
MILGHDFGKVSDFQNSIKRGEENQDALTWKNLKKMLDEYNIKIDDCFFTNVIMGARPQGSALGKNLDIKNKNHLAFIRDCLCFLTKQIEILKPKLIIVLGKNTWQYLGTDFSEKLNSIELIKDFRTLDKKELSIIKDVKFSMIPNYQTNFCFIVHPTYRHISKTVRRHFKNFENYQAEKEIIKSAI